MLHIPAPDPFTVFGLPHSLDLDERTLEQRYLKLSRDCHPDLNRASDAVDCVAVLQRAAEINDAWKVLRDPWQRARALIELRSPGAMERNKRLDAAVLAAALELAEEVAFAGAAELPRLRERLQQALAADFVTVRAAITRGDIDDAARRWHSSHYHKKALADLEAKS